MIRSRSIRMPDFTLSHAFLIEAGEHTDAFMLQYILGHDTIKTTMGDVQPWVESGSRAFSVGRRSGNSLKMFK